MRRFITVFAVCVPLSIVTAAGSAQTLPVTRVLTHREQAPLQARWIAQRFKDVLPALMRRERIDMWIIVSREYNDDPVFRTRALLIKEQHDYRAAIYDANCNSVCSVSFCAHADPIFHTDVHTHYDGVRNLVRNTGSTHSNRAAH